MISANSSTTITIYGKVSASLSLESTFEWYEPKSLTPFCERTSYLLSISLTAQRKDKIAFLASVIAGLKRSGVERYKRLIINEWIMTDFPDPVAPAISMCGILARSA